MAERYEITCTETAVYTLRVYADSEDEAIGLAHDILLGRDGEDGALRVVSPTGTYVDCEVPEREWTASRV